MAAEIKPTKKNSPSIKVGSLKNTLPAEKYATPRNMSGNPVSGGLPASSIETGVEYLNKSKPSIANVSKTPAAKVKTDGVKQRGFGAAVKGYTSRGPLA